MQCRLNKTLLLLEGSLEQAVVIRVAFFWTQMTRPLYSHLSHKVRDAQGRASRQGRSLQQRWPWRS